MEATFIFIYNHGIKFLGSYVMVLTVFENTLVTAIELFRNFRFLILRYDIQLYKHFLNLSILHQTECSPVT